MYNRYLMRPAGEKRFQPNDPEEAAVFAVMNGLQQQPWFADAYQSLDESAANALMEDLHRRILNVLSKVDPAASALARQRLYAGRTLPSPSHLCPAERQGNRAGVGTPSLS